MAIVTFNRKRVESLIGKSLTDEQWKERAGMIGVEIESMLEDDIVASVSPNRPDWLSEAGFARSMRTFLGLKHKAAEYSAKSSDYKVEVDHSVEKVRPYTSCAVVSGLKFDDAFLRSIIQFQEKLHTTLCRNRKKAAIGIYPMERIKWPIRYLAKKPDKIMFRPLDSENKMSAKEILESHPAGKAYAQLLDGAREYPLFIDAGENVLSMPPIINSEYSGRVTDRTKSVFIECSGFDQNFLNSLLNIIVTSLIDSGGVAHRVLVSYSTKKVKTPDFTPIKMALDVDYANKILGTEFKKSQAEKLLEKMGFCISSGKILVPPYRLDILHQRDLAEDIAIAAGYENVKEEIPNVSTIANESEHYIFRERIANLLVGLGFLETNTFHISSVSDQTELMNDKLNVIVLANSLNEEYNSMRHWMLPSLMEVLKNNRHHDYPQKLFGIGTVFRHGKAETGVSEHFRLSIVSSHGKADYTEIRQVIEFLLDRLELKYEVREAEHPSFIPGRIAEILSDGKPMAFFGELHPKVLSNWELNEPTAAIELDIDALFSLIKEK